MGRNCKVCGRHRPHEYFGGKGLRSAVCKNCRKRPKSELEQAILTDEIVGFMDQSNISKKNIKRLEKHEAEEVGEVANLASIVLKIARVKPHKKRRRRFLFEKFRSLYDQAADLGLFEEYSHFPTCNWFEEIDYEDVDEEEDALDGEIEYDNFFIEPEDPDLYIVDGADFVANDLLPHDHIVLNVVEDDDIPF